MCLPGTSLSGPGRRGERRGTAMHHIVQSAGDQLTELGTAINANQYHAVHLAARYDDELEWYDQGLKSSASGIAKRLQMHTSTAREWVRIGHALRELPLIDAAFRANDISYAKARILTRWADPDTEASLLELAKSRSANRLTTAIARALSVDDDGDARDQRLHDDRSFTSYTDGDGMCIIRIALPPSTAKPVIAAVEEVVRRIAQTPSDGPITNPSAGACRSHIVAEASESTASSDEHASANAADTGRRLLSRTLRELRRSWQPAADDDWTIPTLAQQHADAFTVLFLDLDIALKTEVVIHVRGDGNTFDDGTPITTNATVRQLDRSFIRLLIHDAERRPINASSRRRHPTTRQKRVVMEARGNECVDCTSTGLLELDHNPSYEMTRHTITTELEPRCAPCHRARHRAAA